MANVIRTGCVNIQFISTAMSILIEGNLIITVCHEGRGLNLDAKRYINFESRGGKNGGISEVARTLQPQSVIWPIKLSFRCQLRRTISATDYCNDTIKPTIKDWLSI